MRLPIAEVKGATFYQARANKFLEFVHYCSLLDIEAEGSKFAWFHKDQNGTNKAKKLDRVLVDSTWNHAFPGAYAINLPRIYSNHCPIILHLRDNGTSKRGRP